MISLISGNGFLKQNTFKESLIPEIHNHLWLIHGSPLPDCISDDFISGG